MHAWPSSGRMTQTISVTDVRDMYGGMRLLWGLSVLHLLRGCLLLKHMAYPDPISGWSCSCSHIQTMAGHWPRAELSTLLLVCTAADSDLLAILYTIWCAVQHQIIYLISALLFFPKSYGLCLHSTKTPAWHRTNTNESYYPQVFIALMSMHEVQPPSTCSASLPLNKFRPSYLTQHTASAPVLTSRHTEETDRRVHACCQLWKQL